MNRPQTPETSPSKRASARNSKKAAAQQGPKKTPQRTTKKAATRASTASQRGATSVAAGASATRFDVRVLYTLRSSAWRDLVARVTCEQNTITLIGGGGVNLLKVSRNGGKTFASRKVSVGKGLRMIYRDGDNTWVCGQYGMVARARGDGPFELVDVGAKECMQTVFRADGALWTTGDSGAFRSFDGGERWERVDVPGEITRPNDSPWGVLLPSDTGRLFVCKDGVVRETAMSAQHPLWCAIATPTGTILAVGGPGGGFGEGLVLRSEDGGVTSEAIDARAPETLQTVVCTASGRVFAIGKNGTLLCSEDDGRSFFAITHPYTNQWLFGAAVDGERVYLAGLGGLVLVLEPQP